MFTAATFDRLSSQRRNLMGIAIIMVLLYHMHCSSFGNGYLSIFKDLFIGVDIFMFLSGFGLGFSYEKNSLWRFFKNRIKRIFPLFIIQIVIIHIIDYASRGAFAATDVVHELTTASIWTQEGYTNWFVDAILYYYCLFPLLFYCSRKNAIITFIIANIFTIVLLKGINLTWEQECLIARIPVFVMGITCYHAYKNGQNMNFLLLFSVLFGYTSIVTEMSKFYTSAMLCPAIILLLLPMLCNKDLVKYKVTPLLSICGLYSYEIYISNHFTGRMFSEIQQSAPSVLSTINIVTLYTVSSILLGLLFVYISRTINRTFEKQNG